MTAPNLGEADVDIRVDVERIRGPMKTQLLRAAREAGKAAEKELRESGRRAGQQAGRAAGDGFDRAFRARVGRLTSAVVGLLADLGRSAARALGQVIAGIGVAAALGAAAAAAQALSAALVALVAVAAQAAGSLALIPAAGAGLAAFIATLVVGFEGMGEALGAVFEKDPAKLAEALKNLAPAAREVVLEVKRLQPALRDLRLDVQQQLFVGLGRELRQTADVVLPRLRTGLVQVADALRLQGRELLRAFRAPQNLDDLSLTFDNLAQAGRVMATAIRPAVDALISLVTVGSGELPGLAHLIASAAQEFAAFIAEARASGALEEFFEGALAAAADFGRLLLGVGRIVSAVLNAGQETGGGLLNLLVNLTGEVNRFLRSAEGQAGLASFFESVTTIGRALLPVLQALFTTVSGSLAPALAEVARNIAPGLVAFIGALGLGIQSLTPGLIKFTEALSVAFLNPQVTEAIQKLGQGLGNLLVKLAPAVGPLLDALAIGLQTLARVAPDFGQALAEVFIQLAEAIADPEMQAAFEEFLSQLPELIRVLGPAIREIAPIMPDFLQTLTQALKLLIDSGLLGTFTTILGSLTDALSFATPAFSDAAGTFLLFGPLAPVVELFRNLGAAVDAAVAPFKDIDEVVEDAAGEFKTASETIQAAMEKIQDLITSGAQSVLDKFTSMGDQIGALTGSAWANASNITSGGVGGVTSIAGQLAGRVASAISGLTGSLGQVVRSAWNSAVQATASGISAVASAAAGLVGRVSAAIGNLGGALVQAGRDLIQGLINGIRSKINEAVGTAQSLANSVAGAVRGALGVRSPSTVFKEIGVDLLRGLELGLETHESSVLDQLRGLSTQLVSTVTGPSLSLTTAGAAPAPQATSAPVFDVRVFLGTRELTDMVRVEINESNRDLRRRQIAGVRPI